MEVDTCPFKEIIYLGRIEGLLILLNYTWKQTSSVLLIGVCCSVVSFGGIRNLPNLFSVPYE